jgi:predicted GIY-YIG superfamily endonuclease
MQTYVYILTCTDRTFYTGITQHLVRRMLQHASGHSGYTRLHRVHHISYLHPVSNRNIARRLEVHIKGRGAQRYIGQCRFNPIRKNFLVNIPISDCPLALKIFNASAIDNTKSIQ